MLLSLALSLPASAQDVTDGDIPALNAQTFHPSMDSHEFFRAVDSDLGDRGFAARGVLSYTLSPLQYTWWDGSTDDIVANLIQLDAIGAYTVGPFRIGVDLPVVLRNFGGTSTDATGLGDLGIDAKVRLLNPAKAPLGLGFSGRVYVPTSTIGEALGTEGVVADLVLSVDKHIGDRVDAVVDLGFTAQPTVEMENVTWGPTANLQAGLAFNATDRAGFVAEIFTSGVVADFGNAQARPTELLLGGWYRLGERRAIALRPAVAFGLNDAVTSPKARVLLSVAYDPLKPKGPPDTDKDGLVDPDDRCPEVPEDIDSYEDSDGCPELARLVVKVIDTDGVAVPEADWIIAAANKGGKAGASVELPAGDYDVAGPGGVTAKASVPAGGETEVVLSVPAPRGKLAVEIVDAKGQPIPGATWTALGPTPVPASPPSTVAVRPGAYKLTGEAEGYRPAKKNVDIVKDGSETLRLEMVPAKAVLQKEKIEIKDSIYFETAKFDIKKESYPLLDEIAEILLDHPELTKIRIEGNTDSRGSASANLTLSQGRADAVKTYLIGKGVAADRLESIGYGESKPIVKEKTAADQAKNRRVDFFVVGRSDTDVQGPVKQIETKGDKPKDK